MQHDNALPARIAQGWLAMASSLGAMFLMALVRDAVGNDFSRWAADPGPMGLGVVSVLLALYVAMPMLVRHVDARWFRWLAVALAGFCGLFIVAHQLAHALTASRPFDVIHVFDFLHHALALWVVVLTTRWAQQEAPDAPAASVLAAAR